MNDKGYISEYYYLPSGGEKIFTQMCLPGREKYPTVICDRSTLTIPLGE